MPLVRDPLPVFLEPGGQILLRPFRTRREMIVARLAMRLRAASQDAAELLTALELRRERKGRWWQYIAFRSGVSVSPLSRWRASRQTPSDYTRKAVERFLFRYVPESPG